MGVLEYPSYKFICWCPTIGEDEADFVVAYAKTYEDAAEAWVHWTEGKFGGESVVAKHESFNVSVLFSKDNDGPCPDDFDVSTVRTFKITVKQVKDYNKEEVGRAKLHS